MRSPKEHIAEYYLLGCGRRGDDLPCPREQPDDALPRARGFSISLYILCSIDRERERSLEAGLKYLIVGGSALPCSFGSAFVYGATGHSSSRRSRTLAAPRTWRTTRCSVRAA
jgi:hypothetical protein